MPYKKRYYRRRKKKYYRKNIFWHRLGNKSKRWASYLGGLKALKYLNVEKKYNDVTVSSNPSSSGALSTLAGVGQGDTASDREGISVKWTSIHMQCSLIMHNSATHTIVRMMILIDKQPNGSLASITDVLESADINSFNNKNNAYRFKTLMNRKYTLNSEYPEKSAKFNRKLSLHTRYTGSASSVSAINSNNIIFLIVSDEATNTPSVNLEFRLRFVDN